MALPVLNFDFASLQFDMAAYKDSQQSMLSPHGRARSGSSVSDHSLLGFDIHSSTVGSYQLPANDPFQVSSVQKNPLGHMFEDEEQLMLDDFDFEFDGEGKMRDIASGGDDDIGLQFGRQESDSAAGDRIRREHEEALMGRQPKPQFDTDGDFIMQIDDDIHGLPDADPFCPKPHQNSDLSDSAQIEQSPSDIAEAQLKAPRKPRLAKIIESDEQIELRNADLTKWNNQYIENMRIASTQRHKRYATAQAKTNAKIWVFGNGIGNIGQGIGRSHIPSPLDVFTGDELIAAITGFFPVSRVPKRRREEDDAVEDQRQVRPRIDIEEDNLGRDINVEDDVMFNQFEDPEVGRDAPAGLEDHPSSAMPWNVSASLYSYRRASSIPSGRPGSRLTSASPLLGRGSTLGGALPDIERLEEGTDDDFPAIGDLGHLSSSLGPAGRGRNLTPSGDLAAEIQYEIFGPVAAVDTQTANQSQWVKEAMARESMNFFDFVKNTILEADIDASEQNQEDGELARDLGAGEVSFAVLFPPESNTAMVASQAFHHILTLATKSLLGVQQDEVFGDIRMRVL